MKNLWRRWWNLGMLAGLALALTAGPAAAQGGIGGQGGGGQGGTNLGGATLQGLGTRTGTGVGGQTTTGGARTGGTTGGGAATTPSASNTLLNYYGNPLSAGLGNKIALKPYNQLSEGGSGNSEIANFSLMKDISVSRGSIKFGTPLFAATGTQGGIGGNTLGGRTGTLTQQQQGLGFSTSGYRRNAPYMTTISESFFETAPVKPAVTPTQFSGNLKTILLKSSALKSAPGIDVGLDEGTVVLRGIVPNDRERRLAEALLRLTPGVRDVRNELLVVQKGQ